MVLPLVIQWFVIAAIVQGVDLKGICAPGCNPPSSGKKHCERLRELVACISLDEPILENVLPCSCKWLNFAEKMKNDNERVKWKCRAVSKTACEDQIGSTAALTSTKKKGVNVGPKLPPYTASQAPRSTGTQPLEDRRNMEGVDYIATRKVKGVASQAIRRGIWAQANRVVEGDGSQAIGRGILAQARDLKNVGIQPDRDRKGEISQNDRSTKNTGTQTILRGKDMGDRFKEDVKDVGTQANRPVLVRRNSNFKQAEQLKRSQGEHPPKSQIQSNHNVVPNEHTGSRFDDEGGENLMKYVRQKEFESAMDEKYQMYFDEYLLFFNDNDDEKGVGIPRRLNDSIAQVAVQSRGNRAQQRRLMGFWNLCRKLDQIHLKMKKHSRKTAAIKIPGWVDNEEIAEIPEIEMPPGFPKYVETFAKNTYDKMTEMESQMAAMEKKLSSFTGNKMIEEYSALCKEGDEIPMATLSQYNKKNKFRRKNRHRVNKDRTKDIWDAAFQSNGHNINKFLKIDHRGKLQVRDDSPVSDDDDKPVNKYEVLTKLRDKHQTEYPNLDFDFLCELFSDTTPEESMALGGVDDKSFMESLERHEIKFLGLVYIVCADGSDRRPSADRTSVNTGTEADHQREKRSVLGGNVETGYGFQGSENGEAASNQHGRFDVDGNRLPNKHLRKHRKHSMESNHSQRKPGALVIERKHQDTKEDVLVSTVAPEEETESHTKEDEEIAVLEISEHPADISTVNSALKENQVKTKEDSEALFQHTRVVKLPGGWHKIIKTSEKPPNEDGRADEASLYTSVKDKIYIFGGIVVMVVLVMVISLYGKWQADTRSRHKWELVGDLHVRSERPYWDNFKEKFFGNRMKKEVDGAKVQCGYPKNKVQETFYTQGPVGDTTFKFQQPKSNGAPGESSSSDSVCEAQWLYQTTMRSNRNSKIIKKTDRHNAVSVVTTVPKEITKSPTRQGKKEKKKRKSGQPKTPDQAHPGYPNIIRYSLKMPTETNSETPDRIDRVHEETYVETSPKKHVHFSQKTPVQTNPKTEVESNPESPVRSIPETQGGAHAESKNTTHFSLKTPVQTNRKTELETIPELPVQSNPDTQDDVHAESKNNRPDQP